MEVTQLYELVNNATKEAIGDSAILNEDLSNIVDIGTAVFNANAVDKYVKSLVNHIGKVVFVNRVYQGGAPSVLMDAWEFGSVLEKVSTGLPEAKENETWELTDGETYNQDIFYKPSVQAKFYNSLATFEVDMSFAEKQVKQSFSSATQLNGFISMLYTSVENSITVKVDELIMRTIDNMITETIYDDYGSDALDSKSGVKAINLLYLYNDKFNASLTPDLALQTPEFIRFASAIMMIYIKRITKMSKLFNVGGQPRFTPVSDLHLVMLEDFKSYANAYLQSDTFHDEYTKLPEAEGVAYWQGSGENYAFEDVSKIHITNSASHEVEVTGVLATLFDRNALGVSNLDRRVTNHVNAKAEFYSNFYKHDAGYFNDFNENMIVFFIA